MAEGVGTASRKRLYALVAGCFFALLSIWMLKFTALAASWLGQSLAPLGTLLFSFVIPGLVVGYVISGNIHVAQTWIVALANFGFYYGVAYLAQGLWLRLRPKPLLRLNGTAKPGAKESP